MKADLLTTCAKSNSQRANAEIELGVQVLNGGSNYITYEKQKEKKQDWTGEPLRVGC